MRSSIACVRCRRSKVKCVNSGVGTACRSCEAGGRECTYPVPVSSGRRRESVVGQAPRIEGLVEDPARKPRQQRKSNAGLPGHPVPIVTEAVHSPVDALDPTLLTSSVWQELFDIFQLHFSTDLPFIHPPTFLKPLRQANILGPQYKLPGGDPGSAVQPPASTEFLLAFLALTARFHPKIVAHHSPPAGNRTSHALVASDFYAAAASNRIKAITGDKLGIYDLETIQALLMLALHDWGMNRGAQAWASLGVALRSAQAMGLHYENDLDNLPHSRSLPISFEESAPVPETVRRESFNASSSDAFVQAEIRRRTYWTCFILDRYLSNGKHRPQAIHVNDVRIQLPASEQAFLFGEKVRTLMLNEDPETTSRLEVRAQRRASLIGDVLNGGVKRHSFSSNGTNGKAEDEQCKLEVGAEEGLASRYVKILDIYSKIVKWSCGGISKQDKLPPWSTGSQWFALRQALEDFRTSLPRQHLLTPQNTSAHINIRTSTPYTLVHTTFSLCQILLYREFLPFIPFRHGKPQGPLDGTTRTSFSDPSLPNGFWKEGARECFSAARDIMDLVGTCQEWGVAVETPIIGFAIYNVALLGVYLINFPWMDVNGHLRRVSPSREDHIPHGAEAARKALEMIGLLRERLHTAGDWLGTLKRAHKYFSRLRTSWFDSAPRMMQGREREVWNDQSIATAQLHPPDAESTRVLLERVLRDLDGDDEEGSTEMTDYPLLNGADLASPKVKHEVVGATANDAHAQQEERWNAINTAAAAASALSSAPASASQSTPSSAGPNSNSAHFRFYSSYGSGAVGTGAATGSSPNTPSSFTHPSFRPAYSEGSPNSSPNLNTSAKSPLLSSAPTWTSTNGGNSGREALAGIRALISPTRGEVAAPATSGGAGKGAGFATPGQAYSAVQQQRKTNDGQIRDADAWLLGLERVFGGDDVAAFVDGRGVREYARGLRGGWLGVVWAEH